MMRLLVLAAAGVLATGMVAAGTALLLKPPPPAVWHCSGDARGAERRFLVIGDSWATFRPLIGGMAGTAGGKTAGERLRVCALGFSGATTGQIARRMAADPGFEARMEHDLGGRPDTVVIMAGLNDLMLHEGPRAYTEGLLRLTRQAEAFSPHVVSLSLPALAPDAQSTHLARRILGALNRHLHDGGERDARPRYVAAYCAAARHPIVPLPDEITGFVPEAYADAAHLTDAAYRRLGAYLARQVEERRAPQAGGGRTCGTG